MASDITHLAFADEHNHDSGAGRYGSIALITMRKDSYKTVSNRITQSITRSGIKFEFEWTKTKHSRQKDAAISLIDSAVYLALENLIRVDVILWDYHDSRHNVTDRDNVRNFHIMYYHLLRNTLHRFWPDQSIWVLYPHVTTCVNWSSVQSFSNISSITKTEESFFGLSEALKSYHVRQVTQVSSKKSTVSQLADLFAGLIAYSRYCYEKYEAVKDENEGDSLFSESDKEISSSDRQRYKIIQQLLKHKRQQRLGISFHSSRGFRSHNPSKDFPLNFWWYEPQHDKDKAPSKEKA